MNRISKPILHALFPERCPYCGNVVNVGKIACEKCMIELSKEPHYFSWIDQNCGFSAFPYSGIFKTALKSFKFHNNPIYSQKLTVPMYQAEQEFFGSYNFDYITSVPMYPAREKQRGYNQARLLAKDLSKLMKIPYIDFLEKIKDNIPQHTFKSETDRRNNVKGVFGAVNSEKIKGKRILLVDDVKTTGSTLCECIKILNKKGAEEVCFAVLCMRPRD